jgi:hypothetical protein
MFPWRLDSHAGTSLASWLSGLLFFRLAIRIIASPGLLTTCNLFGVELAAMIPKCVFPVYRLEHSACYDSSPVERNQRWCRGLSHAVGYGNWLDTILSGWPLDN